MDSCFHAFYENVVNYKTEVSVYDKLSKNVTVITNFVRSIGHRPNTYSSKRVHIFATSQTELANMVFIICW